MKNNLGLKIHFGLITADATVIMLMIRIHLEDKTLHQELTGYIDYAQKPATV